MGSLTDLVKELDKGNFMKVAVKDLTPEERKLLNVQEGQTHVEVRKEPKLPKAKIQETEEVKEEISAEDLESVGEVKVNLPQKTEEPAQPSEPAPEVEVSAEDVNEYFRCVLSMQRYKESFTFLKSKVKLTLKTKTADETLRLLTLVPKIKNQLGYVNNTISATIIQNLNFLLCLDKLEIDGVDATPVVETFNGAGAEERLIEAAKGINSEISPVVYRACLANFNKFDARVNAMAKRVAEENF